MATAASPRPRLDAAPVIPFDQKRRTEQQVLGAMIKDRLCIPDVVRLLPREEMFGIDAHQLIYRAIVNLHADAKPIDEVAIIDWLYIHKLHEFAGRYDYVHTVKDSVVSSAYAEHHAQTVLNNYLLTKAAMMGDELAAEARAPSCAAVEMVVGYERRMSRLAQDGVTNEPTTIQAAIAAQLEVINQRSSRSELHGIPTGYPDLDKIIVGLQPSEFAAIAARPSVGKTALGACMAANIAATGRGVLFVSLEQSRAEIADRLLANMAMVDSYLLRTGRFSADEADALIKAQSAMAKWRFVIDDAPNQTVTTIAATARQQHRRYGLDVLFIDYLQFVTAENSRMNRYEQIGSISRLLKQLARDLRISVVAMCQVGRDAGDGDEGSPAPKLHQLRESGNIEQDLDVAILLHRAQKGDALTNTPEMIRVDVAKNRNGRRGLLMLAYRPKWLRFESVADGVAY